MQPIFAHPAVPVKEEASKQEIEGPNIKFKFHRAGFRPMRSVNGKEYPQDTCFYNVQTIPAYNRLPEGQRKAYSFSFEAMGIALDFITGRKSLKCVDFLYPLFI